MTAVPPAARCIRFEAAVAPSGAFVLAALWENPPLRVAAATPREAFALARAAAEEAGSADYGRPAVALPLESSRTSVGDTPADASFVVLPLAETATWLVGRCVSMIPAPPAAAPDAPPAASAPPPAPDAEERLCGPGAPVEADTSEPSMETILASIRRIISEDPDSQPAAKIEE